MRYPYDLLLFLLAFCGCTYAWLCGAMSHEAAAVLIADSGAVQLLGFFFIASTALIAFHLAWETPAYRSGYLRLGLILSAYAAREGDLHRMVSVFAKPTQLKFYVHPEVHPGLKLAMSLLVIGFACTLFAYVHQHRLSWWRALKRKQAWAILVLAWIVVFPIPQIQEKLPWNDSVQGRAFEEVVEMLAEMIIFAALMTFRQRHRQKIGAQVDAKLKIAS